MNHQSRQPFGGLSNLPTWRGVVSGCCAVLSTAALAQADDRPGGAPLWEVGGVAFGVSQNAYPGSDQQVNRALALPYFIYRGDVFRADRETAGIRALKTETLELDLGFAGAFGSGSDTIEARQGMRKLRNGVRHQFGYSDGIDIIEIIDYTFGAHRNGDHSHGQHHNPQP